jgi:hypothetical protein
MSNNEIQAMFNEWQEKNNELIANAEHLGVLKERLRIAGVLQMYGETNWIDDDTYRMLMEDLLGHREID